MVQTDASDRGVVAVLAQRDDKGVHPVYFYSRKLLNRETRYLGTLSCGGCPQEVLPLPGRHAFCHKN